LAGMNPQPVKDKSIWKDLDQFRNE